MAEMVDGGRAFPKGTSVMPSFSKPGDPRDEYSEGIRRREWEMALRERELAEREAKVAHREWWANRQLMLKVGLTAEAETGNTAYPAAGHAAPRAVDHLQDE
ncbi:MULTISPECIES: hypothetical protein [unclassified Streptomyces]|uniref:hypothetical protein n=1 Tax=unclassified Streptomyces TaxID=2593676 RepID=UPI0033E6539E